MNVKALKPHGGNAKLRKELKRIQGLIDKNRLVEARQLCDQVYSQEVRNTEFLHMYGLTLRACGDLEGALVKIFAAHEEKPADAKILNSLGLVFLDMKDAETAVTMFKRATSVDERLYDAWVNLGTALKGLGRFDAAELAFKGAHFLHRSKPEPVLNIALMQVEMHRYERAAEILDGLLENHRNVSSSVKLLRLQIAMELEDLEYVKEHVNRIDCAALNDEERTVLDSVKAQYHVIHDQFDEAIAILEKTIARKGPHRTDQMSHLGFCYGLAGRIDDGIATLKQLLDECPAHATGRHNLALLQFRNGDLAEGFKNYEARWHLKEFSHNCRRFDAPRWRGEPIEGKSILVWREQGIGDEVRFASLLPELNELGCSITFECKEKLLPLWKRSFPWATIRPAGKKICTNDPDYMGFDYQIPVGSLGAVFRNSILEFDEKQKPWIARDHEAEARIRKQLAIRSDELLIGVCWRSSIQITSRDKVFLNCEQLQAFQDLPKARWLNVQYDGKDEEIETIRKCGLDMHHYVDLDQMNDLVGACNLLGACDVVISVGVSVGDLAGGLGTPLIYLTPELSEAFLGTDHVPWFVNCKSYRIRAFKADDTLARIVSDWPSITRWVENLKSEERKTNGQTASVASPPPLDLEYPIV